MKFALAGLALALALALLACGGESRPKNADELLAPLTPVKLGSSFAELRQARPSMTEVAAGSYVDAETTNGFSVDTDGDVITGIRIEMTGRDGKAAEQRLRDRLGSGAECSPLPADVDGFRTTLWKLPDGSGVTASRMGDRVKLRFVKPVDAAFESALASCPGLR